MKTSLEQAWLQISTDLDEVLDLDAQARQAWFVSLETRDPDRAERVRPYMLDLEKLESDHFLARALPSVLAVNTSPYRPRHATLGASARYSTVAAFAEDLERHLR